MGKQVRRLSLFILVLMTLINLIAALGPELGFDALFYHLTLPKLYLLQGRWYYPGLLYISAMPRLAETLFIPALKLLGTQGPKLIQYFSGLIASFLTYKLAKKFSSKNIAVVAALLFYNTWLVSWQSGSAYIDLFRTVLELSAIYFIVQDKQYKLFKLNLPNWLISGIFFGLAVGTKWHALASLMLAGLIFNPLIIPVALLVSAPWFYLAFHFTGNPVYPLLESSVTQSQISQVPSSFYNPLQILKRLLLSPIYIGKPYDTLINPLFAFIFPVGLFLSIKNNTSTLVKISLYTLASIIVWQLTPPPSGRYLLQVLPLIAIISSQVLTIPKKAYKNLFLFLIFLTTFLVSMGRLWANSKYLPVILGQQSKNQFLTSQSARLPDTFIDSDSWVENNLNPDKKVLVTNLHNLYYLPISFDHQSWADKDYPYPYLITKNQDSENIEGKLLHTNSLGIQVFKIN